MSAGTLQELVTKYTFEVDSKPLEKVEEKLSGLIGFATKLAVAASGAAATVFGVAASVAHAGDEALAASQKLGMTVENLTSLQFAAKLSNVEAENFNVSMRFLNRNMNEATTGNADAARTFRKLGVSIKDAHGQLRPTNDVLLAVASKIKAMPDGAKKTAVAMDIFGRAGADLIPLLNEGAAGIQKLQKRSDELGFTMSTELAKAGDEFNDTLDEMKFGLLGIRNLIGAQLMPVLLPLIKTFIQWIVVNRQLISSKLNYFLRTFLEFAQGAFRILSALVRIVSALTTMFGGFESTMSIITNLLLIFAGAKMLYMIGSLTVSLFGLASAFTAANIAALAVPIAIGAAVALAVLLLEDLFTYFNDDKADTLFGSLLKGASSFFGEMPKWGQWLITFMLTPLRSLITGWRVLKALWDFDPTTMKGWKDLGNDVGGALKQLATGGDSLGEAAGITPAYSPAVTSRQERNFLAPQTNVTNNINVGDSADPMGIAKSVQIGTQTGIDSSLRGAQRSFSKKGAY